MRVSYSQVIPPPPQRRPPDAKWGSLDPSSDSWNGMVGMVARGEADLALGPFGVTEARARAVDFSLPLTSDSWTVLSAAPQVQADPWIMAKSAASFRDVIFFTFSFFIESLLF